MSGALFALSHLVLESDIGAVDGLSACLDALNGEFFDLGGDGLKIEQGGAKADRLDTCCGMADASTAECEVGLGEEFFSVGFEVEGDASCELLLDDFPEGRKVCDASVDVSAYDAAVEFDVGFPLGDVEVGRAHT